MKITMEDIARMAGVSKATVSRVVNNVPEGVSDKTRRHVQDIIDSIDYRPDVLGRMVSRAKTNTIGLILPDITNPFYAHVVKAVGDHLEANGYTLLLSNSDGSFETEQKQISTFITKHVDGIILTSSSDRIDEVRCLIFKFHVPLVLLDRMVASIQACPGVFIDNEYALFGCTEHLIRNGHRRIAYITGPPDVSTTQERIAGYLAAHKHYALPFQEELLVNGEYTHESGYQLVHQMLSNEIAFTALLAGNDLMATGALKALKERELSVPKDIELIGFDNVSFSGIMSPALSSVEQPVRELGRRAAEMMLTLVTGRDPDPMIVRLEPKIVLRDTTINQK